ELKATALFTAVDVREVYLRRARVGKTVWIDTGDDKWRAIKVTADGWSYTPLPDVRFRRTAEMAAFPAPISPEWGDVSASMEEVARYFGFTSDNLLLVIGAVTFALAGTGTYPIVCVHGEGGSGKTSRVLRMLSMIDPHADKTELVAMPKTREEVFVIANARAAPGYDNASGMSFDVSDAMCVVATGGSTAKRKLYSDMDEALITAHAPQFLNGVEELHAREDFLSRAIVIEVEPFQQGKRKTEAQLKD